METLLDVIVVLGFGALVISTWVFANTTRRYVTGEDYLEQARALESDFSPYRERPLTPRSGKDRRSGEPVIFPITVNGVRVDQDRRRNRDRRRSSDRRQVA